MEGNPGSIQALYLVVHELGAQSDGASRGVFDRYVGRVAANDDLDIAAIDHHDLGDDAVHIDAHVR